MLELSDLHLYLSSVFVVVVFCCFCLLFLFYSVPPSNKFLVTALLLIARCHGDIPLSVII
jgi:hypothetical protein